MWTYHPELLARPVPRYTSYPTAAEFTDSVDSADMESAIDQLEPETAVSLYLHIPYCREICWYCGCNTGAATREARLAAYVARLHDEIDLVASRVAGKGVVRRIAFGGGSPNAIAPAEFLGLLEQVRTAFRCDHAVVSVELDPRGFDEDWSRALAQAEVKRVSLGVQTFDPEIQARIGRVQPYEDIVQAVDLLRRAGIESLNFDLMYGLPGQDEARLQETLKAAMTLAPDRLAVFGYAHVPSLIPRQRQIDGALLPSASERFAQASAAYAFLTEQGYEPVGFDHFALPGDPLARATREGRLRRNFQGYTDDSASCLIGIGASAISEFPDRLLQNEKNTGRWHLAIGGGRFAIQRGLRRSPEDRARGRIIEDLLTCGRADLAPLLKGRCFRGSLMEFEARKLLHWTGSTVVLADEALPYARSIAARIDSYRDFSPGRFSNAV